MTKTPDNFTQSLNARIQEVQQTWDQVAQRAAAEFVLAEERRLLGLLDTSMPGVADALIAAGWSIEDLELMTFVAAGGHSASELLRHFTTNNASAEILRAITVRLEQHIAAVVEATRCGPDENQGEVLGAFWDAVREDEVWARASALIGLSALLLDEPLSADFAGFVASNEEALHDLRGTFRTELDAAFERLTA
jgi:hypothetical protein